MKKQPPMNQKSLLWVLFRRLKINLILPNQGYSNGGIDEHNSVQSHKLRYLPFCLTEEYSHLFYL
ncbi:MULTISPECIES: hypothetical protein [Planktothrix]|jgi:hypothetical protein|uniref:hypothetical protein n=1 Tax=Planktothrix TaxID=54304 RepID=UPI00047EB6D1|nr:MULTISPECIES: hypothetical protein [Planktothrix]MCF3579219.1 hypothetical protein [Planktothrix agardhii 1811]MBG0746356.1 hypothetical protein [Planktothrix agardhii KL2]MCB8757879.1 hypothetical protein [Planktothrix agardhii 1813]MCB8766369.1 hypothetical protein [Planktothrix agardhii 1809]MCB8779989.1 hypothetical protein [Planktothrix agardhii 1031]